MPSTDFAAAQQRIKACREQRLLQNKTRFESQRSFQALTASDRLHYPLNRISRHGIEVWDAIKGREGTRPAFRVGQVDAELLDEELVELFRSQVGEALKYYGVTDLMTQLMQSIVDSVQSHLRDEWSSEILLAVRAILFKLTIWDHDASYGAALQNLRYTDARHKGLITVSPSRWQKAGYGFFTVGGRYAWTKWEEWLTNQEGGYEEPSPIVRLVSRISSFVSTSHSIAAFTSFLIFLVNGRYRTLIDRILQLRLAPITSQVSREVSFEYLNRQLVWHAFTEFLLFLLPLVGISRWRRWLSRAWRKTKQFAKQSGNDGEDDTPLKGELAFLPERTCAICYQDQNPSSTSENELLAITGASGGVIGSAQTDVTNAYETIPCGCVYCYVCIGTKLDSQEREGWICLRCGELVKECRPWKGDILERTSRPATGKSVSSSDEKEKETDTHELSKPDADP